MTIEIPLTQGKVALIDDGDMPLVGGRKWYAHKSHNTFYAYSCRKLNGEKTFIAMHQVILGTLPNRISDHVDGNGLNNTRGNLRQCTSIQNNQNRRAVSATSRYKGVCFKRKKWYANIHVFENGKSKQHYLGTFESEIDAAKAYDAAAKMYHGKFARLNFG